MVVCTHRSSNTHISQTRYDRAAKLQLIRVKLFVLERYAVGMHVCGCVAHVRAALCVRSFSSCMHTIGHGHRDAPPPRPLQALGTALSVYRVWPTTQYVRAPIEVMTPFLQAIVPCGKVKGDQHPIECTPLDRFFVVVTVVSIHMQRITLTSHQQRHPSRTCKVQEYRFVCRL